MPTVAKSSETERAERRLAMAAPIPELSLFFQLRVVDGDVTQSLGDML
jgi:hypothetical protein